MLCGSPSKGYKSSPMAGKIFDFFCGIDEDFETFNDTLSNQIGATEEEWLEYANLL